MSATRIADNPLEGTEMTRRKNEGPYVVVAIKRGYAGAEAERVLGEFQTRRDAEREERGYKRGAYSDTRVELRTANEHSAAVDRMFAGK